MSLNRREVAATAKELAANVALAGLSEEALAARAGLDLSRYRAALTVDGAEHPADVWRVRDTVEDAVLGAGRTPVPYSKLTDGARSSAERWFGYRR